MRMISGSTIHRYLALVCVFLVAVALIAGVAGCNDYTPPPSQNLEIRDWYDLDDIGENLAGNHILMNDLDSTTPGYDELASPIANEGRGWGPIWHFTGSFDGQGYEIRDLFINCPNCCTVGLFAEVREGGRIEGLGVVNANVTGDLDTVSHGCNIAGILVGANLGTVDNCYCTGSLICEWPAGGVVGENYGIVSNSYYSGNVTSNKAGGGLVGVNSESDDYPYPGLNTGTVTNSYYNYDEVLINGENIITIGALSGDDFEQWLANGKFLDINERLSEENGYYLINNISDFKQLLAFGQNDTLKFRLTDDLDMATEPDFYIPYLAGKFDGNGHKISNLGLNFSFVHSVGLFGYLAPGGKVTQVDVDNINIIASRSAGGLVGYNCEGTVSHSYCTGNVAGGSDVGGLVGLNNGIVNDSYFNGSVTGGSDAGGLVGGNEHSGTVINSYSTGTVTGTRATGGLVGQNWRGTVMNSYSTGNVAGDFLVGGLVGQNKAYEEGEGTITNSYSTGKVTGESAIGGLVGQNSGTVIHSFWDYETSGRAYSDGGTVKTTAEMQNIATFSGATWDITIVANPGIRNSSYIWNIVDGLTYPFLSWQP